jgi:hypothetical protein
MLGFPPLGYLMEGFVVSECSEVGVSGLGLYVQHKVQVRLLRPGCLFHTNFDWVPNCPLVSTALYRQFLRPHCHRLPPMSTAHRVFGSTVLG